MSTNYCALGTLFSNTNSPTKSSACCGNARPTSSKGTTRKSEAGRRARERPGIDPELLQWLADRPHRRTVEFGGRKILMVHSTPWEPRGTYVYPHSTNLDRFAEVDADFVMYGHTHTQLVRRIGRVTIVNPGSAGDARDSNNGRQLSFAVLETETGEVTVTDYPDPRYAPRNL
jgi:predicted phosphodiesterase